MDGTGYKLLLTLHILSGVVAFGPQFVYPAMKRAGATREVARLHLYMTLPALVLSWAFGMGLVGLSDEVWKMSQTWIVLALITWVVTVLVNWFLVRPALAGERPDVKQKLAMGTGITHLMLVVTLWLMVFKPFLDRG